MAMTLTIIFFAAGFMAMLYGVVAGLSMLKYMRLQKSLPEKIESTGGDTVTIGPPVAEAFCNRARLLLKRQRFDAALVDCKRAIDLNPNHTVAHTLWEHALEKEIPPELIPEAVPEETKPPLKKKRVLKKRRKVAKPVSKKVAVKKKPAAKPVPEEQPEEIKEEAVAAKEAPPKEPPVPKKKAAVKEPVVTPEPVAEPEEVKEEPVAAKEAPPKKPPVPKKKAAVKEPVVTPEPVAEPEEVKEEPVAAKEAPPKEPPVPRKKAAVKEPVVTPEPVAEPEEVKEEPVIAKEAPPEEPIVPEEEALVEDEVPTEEPPARLKKPALGPDGEEVPILKDRIPSEEPKGESLLDEIDHEKLREFEKGEATSADGEWTRYADKEGPELAESKIQMHELPAEAAGLKETIIDLKQAEAYNLQGETNISKNLYNNAIKDFTRAININPKFVDALINRGSAYAKLGRFNDALTDFNDSLKYEKKDAVLYNKRGEIFLQNNLFDQAIKDFSSAIVLNPMFSDAFLNRGRAYSEKSMPEEAMNDFNQAIKADSDHANMPFVDRAAPAIQEDEESLADKDAAESLNQQGLANMEKELYDEAIKNFSQAIDMQTTFADAYINRGKIYTLQNNLNKALADFNQAVMFDPLNAEVYYWRAQAWKAKKDHYNTTEDLKLACEMGFESACLEYKKLKTPTK
jgi:tetratricopeptide (TPR) repeat protein